VERKLLKSNFTNKLTFYFLHYSDTYTDRLDELVVGQETAALLAEFQKSLFDE
jgi:hypothetical protein